MKLRNSILNSQGLKLITYVVTSAVLMFFMMFVFLYSAQNANSSTPRIKDIVSFEGIRENILVGYGLVVGLKGTGDKLNNSAFTEKSLQSFLDRLGVSTINQQLKVKNVAAVSVTAKLPAFARAGSKLDVTISTLGDATSIEGGTLIATPLMGADGQMYAVAQGPVSIGGFLAEGKSNSVSKGIPTKGQIASGGIVEREIAFELDDLDNVKIALKTPDLTTAKKIEESINKKLGDNYAKATDPGTITLAIPLEYSRSIASLLADIELLEVPIDSPARIVIDENTGTIVMNENVKIDTVAVAQGNLVVTISRQPVVSQPGALAPNSAQTVKADIENVQVNEAKGNIAVLQQNAGLQDLVTALNLLGVSTRDLIVILQNIKTAGALYAEIETR